MTQSSRFVSLCKNIQRHLESDRPVAVDMITRRLIRGPRGASRRTDAARSLPPAKVVRASRDTSPAGSVAAADTGGDEGGDPDPERPQTNPVVKGGA